MKRKVEYNYASIFNQEEEQVGVIAMEIGSNNEKEIVNNLDKFNLTFKKISLEEYEAYDDGDEIIVIDDE